MARSLRIEYPGAVYHVTSRGNAQLAIYLTDADRELFIEVLDFVVERFGWVCHAYCLMDNHYHLMIETPKGNLSRGMRQLNGVYTQRFNREHKRVGHVFQGRYKAILVEKDAHLLELCRYIVRNPVAANMVAHASQWAWSSYRATAGLDKKLRFCSVDWVLEQFGGSQQRYVEFVETAPLSDAPLGGARRSQVFGSDEFKQSLQAQSEISQEVPRVQKYIARPSLEDLAKSGEARGKWMTDAYQVHGYTMAEIAKHVGVHYSLVSKVIKNWREDDSRFKM